MKILIIGGTGLISTPITRILLEQGADVTLYNRGKSEIRFPGSVKVITGDRRDYPAFEAQMQAAGTFDCVIDMVGFEPADGESAVRAFQGRIGQFIFCSTVDVYTKPASRLPYTEAEPRHAISDYGRKKVMIEDILDAAHARRAFNVTHIRPAHTYGEGGSIIHSFGWSPAFIDRIRKGKPVVVHGDGNSLWVSCHVEDVARAFVAAIGNPAAYGKAYHTAGEEWMTWNEYHRKLAAAIDAPEPTLIHIPSDTLIKLSPERAGWTHINFQFSNIFDNTAARRDLNFRYTIPWMEGVRRTVAWLEANHRIQNSDEDPFDDQVIAAWQTMENQLIAAIQGKA